MKPGIKTTEFWLALAVVIFPLVQKVMTGAIDWQIAVGSALTAIAYAFSRGMVKKTH